MTRDEMLRELGLTQEQLKDLLKRHSDFMNSLDAAQKALVKSWSPSLEAAARSFGPGATAHDVQNLINHATPHGSVANHNVAKGNPA